MQEALRQKYLESLNVRATRIDSLIEKLSGGSAKADENARLMGHSLLGSGGSFGFPEVSEAGQAVEKADRDDLINCLKALKAVLEKVVADHFRPEDSADAPQENSQSSQAVDETNGKESHKGSGGTGEGAGESEGDSVVSGRTEQTGDDEKDLHDKLDILVVDDDPELTDFICDSLLNLNKESSITVASTGAQAQEFLVKQPFDLIIMDLMLPDRDGRELIKEIKLEFRLNSPLLVLSGIQKDSVRVECMSLGADKYLSKPFYEEDLHRELEKLLDKEVKRKLTLVPMDGEAADEEEEKSKSGVLKGNAVLLAEDDKIQASLIMDRLVQDGAAVSHVSNGREAMQKLRTTDYNLVILDVRMPIMDGFEVLERIRGELDMKDVPVIMVTAVGSEEDIIRGYDLGATDYILKPFSEVLLVARVKSLLKKRIA